MSLLEINWNPNRKVLRSFGIIALTALTLIALLFHVFKGLDIRWALIIFAAGFIIFLSSMISEKLTRIIYLGLVIATLPVGWTVSFILLAAFYFLLLTPLGFIFRLLGRDLLHRRFDSAAKSYWVARGPQENLDRYFHQF